MSTDGLTAHDRRADPAYDYWPSDRQVEVLTIFAEAQRLSGPQSINTMGHEWATGFARDKGEDRRQWAARAAAERKANGLCVACGKCPPEQGNTSRCTACKERRARAKGACKRNLADAVAHDTKTSGGDRVPVNSAPAVGQKSRHSL